LHDLSFSDVVRNLESRENAADLISAYQGVIASAGCVGFVAADFSTEDRARLLLYSSMPDVFSITDAASPWWSDDPAAARLAAGEALPFRIEDAYDERLPSASARWEYFETMNLTTGWVFPTSRPGSIGGVLTLYRRSEAMISAMDEQLALMHSIAIYFHSYMTALNPSADGHHIIRNTLIPAAREGRRRSLLTPREVDCLHHCSRGKTAVEIATLEGISVHTVRDHIRNAMMKLDARTQAQGVSKAIRYGFFKA